MSVEFSLSVKNESEHLENVILYLESNESGIGQVAWLSRKINPNTVITFSWTKDFCFSWFGSGIFTNAAYVEGENLEADPENPEKNEVTLTKENGAYMFKQVAGMEKSGCLTINADNTIPVTGGPSVGIGLSDNPALVCQSTANYKYCFNTDISYWIALGSYEKGEMINVNQLISPRKIAFPINIYRQRLCIQPDHTWSEPEPLDL